MRSTPSRLSILSQLLPAPSTCTLCGTRSWSFQFFPSCYPAHTSGVDRGQQSVFQFFPSCYRSSGSLSGSSARPFQFFPSCYLETLKAARKAGAPDFQFFPSCYLAFDGKLYAFAAEAFNSFPVATGYTPVCHSNRRSRTFNSFPVATWEVLKDVRSEGLVAFNSFPVATRSGGGAPAGAERAFNSFPVATATSTGFAQHT